MRIGTVPWTPTNIATTSWYDASDASTITETGGAVSQWADKSGNGNDATQGTGANQPTIDVRTLNGVAIMGFLNSSSQYFVMDSNVDFSIL